MLSYYLMWFRCKALSFNKGFSIWIPYTTMWLSSLSDSVIPGSFQHSAPISSILFPEIFRFSKKYNN